ncbi:MAG: hypothetical protein WDZ38_08420, partial [Balneolaceae bacterium]
MMEADKSFNPSAVVFFSAIAIITPLNFSVNFIEEFHKTDLELRVIIRIHSKNQFGPLSLEQTDEND